MRKLFPRTLMSLVLLAAVGGWIGCETPGSPEASRRPVLLITVGGLVPADLGAFGGPNALPRFAAFAEQGTTWSDALSAAPMTRPAIATYLTGLAPDRHGVRDDIFASLPAGVPTLAELMAARGYTTAAFPDSSFLSDQSGLWRGFDLVHTPPAGVRSPARWLPQFHTAGETDVPADWIRSLDEDAAWFGWVHLSYPLLGQFREIFNRESEQEIAGLEGEIPGGESEVATLDPTQTYEASLQDFDRQLGKLLDAVEARGDGALVVLAGTLGDVRGDLERQIPMGMGFSLDDTRVDVPVVIRFPGDAGPAQAGAAVWSPDVAATIAAWAGVKLDGRAEGLDLAAPGETERTIFSWSWAPLDQFGWHPLTLVADSSTRIVLDGDRVMGDPQEGPEVARLLEALAGRDTPERPRLPADVIETLLSSREIEPKPVGAEGRDFPDPEDRRVVTGRVWLARSYYMRNNYQRGHNLIAGVGRRRDPENIASWLDRGHAMAFSRDKNAARVLGRAVLLRPWDGDIWHWYAHALLRSELESAEEILIAIQPHLTDQADVLYDLACTRSLLEDENASADYLARAWHAGFRDRNKIESDADLRHLRETGKLSEVMRELQ